MRRLSWSFLALAFSSLIGQPLAAADGIHIAVGNGLHRMASNDGLDWQHVQSVDKPGHNQNDLKALAVGSGVCVAVGGFSKSNILTTKDGMEWHKNDFNAGVLSGVVFHNGKFYAFGEGGRVIESVDGYQWKRVGDGDVRAHTQAEAQKLGLEKPIKSNVRSWRFARGRYVGTGDNGIVLSTTDFNQWHYSPRIEPQSRLYLETDGKGFIAVGDATLHHSADGMTWQNVTPGIGERTRFASLIHDGARYLVNARDGSAWESMDGRDWRSLAGVKFPGYLASPVPGRVYSFANYWQWTEDLKFTTDGGKTWRSAQIPFRVGVTRMIFAEGFSGLKR